MTVSFTGCYRCDDSMPAPEGAVKAWLRGEQRQQHFELELGLLQLGGRVGVGDDPAAGEEMSLAVAYQRRAQADADLAVLRGVHPADRARVPAAIDALELVDQLQRTIARLAADRRRRMQVPRQFDGAVRLRQ